MSSASSTGTAEREPVAASVPAPPSEVPARRRRVLLRGSHILPAGATLAIVLGTIAWSVPAARPWSTRIWLAGLAIFGAPVVWRALRDALRGRFATDLVAMLAIVAAVPLDEPLAGLIVVLMQTGGEALEHYAQGRASAAVRALEEDAPRIAHLMRDGRPVDLPVDAIAIGHRLLIRPGEMIPSDGIVIEGHSLVDGSRITGEPDPIGARAGTPLLSGMVNLEGALTMRATAPAAGSQYARIVELVRTAQERKAPLQRLADRYAVWFTPLTLVVCAIAWLVSGDPTRVLAVLVVATPCPLILATPVAIIGGINRAARRQIIVRSGGALEQLADVRIVALDKTGTVTVGLPRVKRVLAVEGTDAREVLRLAGAVEERSGHLLARTLVEAAHERGIEIPVAGSVVELAGRGVEGRVEGKLVSVGSRSFLRERRPGAETGLDTLEPGETGLRAYVAIDGRAAGIVEYADALRPRVTEMLDALRDQGIHRIVLLSGDDEANTRAIGGTVGVHDAIGDLLPEDKVRIVRDLGRRGEAVLMVGDGTNDAPALSAASVGIALAGHGGGIATEAADAVLLVDDPTRIVDAIAIGRRTLRIARQSIWVGLGLSGIAMLVAAAGYIPPVFGALLQEGIDVAVILNALRASAGD